MRCSVSYTRSDPLRKAPSQAGCDRAKGRARAEAGGACFTGGYSMGEAADDSLEGLLCQVCGSVIDGQSPGFPRECGGCEREGTDEMTSDMV